MRGGPDLIRLERHVDGHWVKVSVTGELDVSSVPKLKAALTPERLPGGRTSVALDVSGLTFCDSSGLNSFLDASRALEARGGELVLLKPSDSLTRRLWVTGLHRVLTVRENPDSV